MRRVRIFQKYNEGENFLVLDKNNRHYLENVLRLKNGEVVEILTGGDRLFEGIFCKANGECIIKSISEKEVKNNIPVKINLFMGTIKGSPFDYAIEKASEIGVYSITPVYCNYSSVRVISYQKIERFKKIASSSALQSGRNKDLIINHPMDLKQALNRINDGNNLYLHPYAGFSIGEIFKNNVNFDLPFNVFSGPEGGFSEQEIDMFNQRGIMGFSLNTNILRAETIPLVISTIILYEYGRRCNIENGR